MICSKHGASDKWAQSAALLWLLVTLWAATHRYQGLGGDAELYAVQAWSRIHPNLSDDLFLRNVSQDSYTIFSPFYAWWMRLLGLRSAALTLTIMFKVWFFAAAWALARNLFGGRLAFAAVAVLITIVGGYGAYGVFHYAEDWLTARTMGETLVVTALMLYFHGFRAAGVLVACGAMFVHPLMALPGVLLLASLSLPPRWSAIGAALVLLATLAFALAASRLQAATYGLGIIDGGWLEVVRQRSQFLFLQLWSEADWKQAARPFGSLMLSTIALDEARVRRLCISAMLVGAAGLGVAFIGSVIGPAAVLLQGQAWRWVWITTFVAILLLAPTASRLHQGGQSGRFCAALMICAWTIPFIDGTLCMACAFVAWMARDWLSSHPGQILRWAVVGVVALIFGWVVKSFWAVIFAPATNNREIWVVALIRSALQIKILALAVITWLAYLVTIPRSAPRMWAINGLLFAFCVFLLPSSLRDTGSDGTPSEIEEFADWRAEIPPDSNVFVVPAHNSATFAWFTLERPSYLTVDQSSGVVFSRSTALEVRRRSQNLLPLMDPDWMLLSNMRKTHDTGAAKPSTQPLTRGRLISLCSDPQLNYVVAGENVGFEPIRHAHPGPWNGWNLYDCRKVASEADST